MLGGSRIPLLIFGGQVTQWIESNWHSHASILKVVIDLLQLPPFGVPCVDSAASLASRVVPTLQREQPPAHGLPITQSTPPNPAPAPMPPAPWDGPVNQPLPDLVGNNGATMPSPTDSRARPNAPVSPTEAM